MAESEHQFNPIHTSSVLGQSINHAGRIRKLVEKLGETLEFRLAFDGEMPGSDGGVVVLEKMPVLQVLGLRYEVTKQYSPWMSMA